MTTIQTGLDGSVPVQHGINADSRPKHESLAAAYIARRLGVFYHLSLATYTGVEWSPANEPPQNFRPDRIDCRQWMEAAQRMGAGYAILTTKHHDGFCLWPSRLTGRSVAAAPGVGDVVDRFVTACRQAGIAPGLYFSIWDTAHGPSIFEGNGDNLPWNAERESFVFGQIAELLTGYGPIACLWFDGCWAGMVVPRGEDVSRLGRRIRELVKFHQPDCQVLFNWHRDTIANGMADIRATEVQCGLPAADNVLPHEVCSKGTTSHWFWQENDLPLDPDLLVYGRIAPTIGGCGCHLLNLPPDRSGLLPEHCLELASQIGTRLAGLGRIDPITRIHIRQTPAWTIGPEWTTAHDQHGSSITTTTDGATAQVAFTGPSLRLIGRRFGDSGLIDLTLDGKPLLHGLDVKTDLDLLLPRQILYERHDLSNGPHHLKIALRACDMKDRRLCRLALEAVETGPVV